MNIYSTSIVRCLIDLLIPQKMSKIVPCSCQIQEFNAWQPKKLKIPSIFFKLILWLKWNLNHQHSSIYQISIFVVSVWFSVKHWLTSNEIVIFFILIIWFFDDVVKSLKSIWAQPVIFFIWRCGYMFYKIHYSKTSTQPKFKVDNFLSAKS